MPEPITQESGAGEDGTGKALSTAIYRVQVADQSFVVAIIEREAGLYLKVGDGPEQSVAVAARTADGELSVLLGGALVRGLVGAAGPGDDGVTVVVDGHTLTAVVQDERAVRLASAAAAGRPQSSVTTIRAPMPGLVVSVSVTVGEQVTRGATLVVLSAMKMQNELTAPADGTIAEVLVSAEQTVDQNQVLVRLE
jgi:biotin carboxyl carrier protein